MFTGIIETTGIVQDTRTTKEGARITVDVSSLSSPLSPGASLAINGVCLTAVNPTRQQSQFDVVHETLQRSTLKEMKTGSKVNLEPAMLPHARLDGHFVQGHVDAVAEVIRIDKQQGQWLLWISASLDMIPLLIPKGSVAIDGVSLTIAQTQANRFGVAIVPTTLEQTIIADYQPGRLVNIETDILARAVFHQIQSMGIMPGDNFAPSTLSHLQHFAATRPKTNMRDALAQHGFL